NNSQYRFGMPGEPITKTESKTIHEAILKASPFPEIVVISGSLPEGLDKGFLTTLIKELKARNVKIIADTSGDALTEVLNEGVYLVKPNLGELSKFTGHEELDNESAGEAAKQL